MKSRVKADKRMKDQRCDARQPKSAQEMNPLEHLLGDVTLSHRVVRFVAARNGYGRTEGFMPTWRTAMSKNGTMPS